MIERGFTFGFDGPQSVTDLQCHPLRGNLDKDQWYFKRSERLPKVSMWMNRFI